MTEAETAWLAGLLEGEGCFSVYDKGRRKPSIVVGLCMTDKDVVLRACDLMGLNRSKVGKRSPAGRSRNQGPGRDVSRWSNSYEFKAHAADAVRVMRAVRPYMGARRGAKIDECLASRPDLTGEETK